MVSEAVPLVYHRPPPAPVSTTTPTGQLQGRTVTNETSSKKVEAFYTIFGTVLTLGIMFAFMYGAHFNGGASFLLGGIISPLLLGIGTYVYKKIRRNL